MVLVVFIGGGGLLSFHFYVPLSQKERPIALHIHVSRSVGISSPCATDNLRALCPRNLIQTLYVDSP